MRGYIVWFFALGLILGGAAALAAEIHLPGDTNLHGNVLIAEQFYKTEVVHGKQVQVPLPYRVWPGKNGMRDSDYFDVRIEAHPGDVIMLTAGTHKFDVWIYTPGITITTDPATAGMADIWGTVEVDADNVTLDGIAVTGPRKTERGLSSGHGIELNREHVNKITIRNCLVKENEWMGIHVIGVRGEIEELRVEDSKIVDNGSFGIECQTVKNLVVTGCTITGNLEGVHIGSYVDNVILENNTITGNRKVDVYRKQD